MIKILHVTKYYPPYIGGTESLAHDTCAALKDDYEQKVFAFNDGKETIEEVYDGIDVIRVGVWKVIASQPIAKGYYKKLRDTILSFKPDVIHFDYPNPFAAHYLLKAIKKTKWKGKFILFWVMDIIKQKSIERLFRHQTIKLLDMAETVQMLSPVYNKDTSYLPFYEKRYRVLAPRVGDSRMTVTEGQKEEAKLIKEKYPGKFLCFFFGRHVPYKGLHYLIEANKHLDRSKVQIVIGGRGPLTDSLKKEAEQYDNIEFVGRLSDDQVNAYLLACDAFAFPSITRNEAYGISLAEALYFGKPGLTFTIKGSGVNWVSPNGVTGLEAPNCDAEAYAKNIARLASDAALYEKLSKNAFQRAHELYSLEAFVKSAKDIYQELLEDTNQ